MTDVVVAQAFKIAESHRQPGLCPVQGLDLALLVHTEHHRVFRGIQVEPDNVPHLLDEERIGRELEVLLPVRLDAEGVPDPLNGGLAQTGLDRDRAARPVGATTGLGLDGLLDEGADPLVLDTAGTARSALVVESHQPLPDEPLSPEADHRPRQTDLFADRAVVHPVGCHENDLRSPNQRVRERTRPSQGLKFLTNMLFQDDRGQGTTNGHGNSPLMLRERTMDKRLYTVIHGTLH